MRWLLFSLLLRAAILLGLLALITSCGGVDPSSAPVPAVSPTPTPTPTPDVTDCPIVVVPSNATIAPGSSIRLQAFAACPGQPAIWLNPPVDPQL